MSDDDDSLLSFAKLGSVRLTPSIERISDLLAKGKICVGYCSSNLGLEIEKLGGHCDHPLGMNKDFVILSVAKDLDFAAIEIFRFARK